GSRPSHRAPDRKRPGAGSRRPRRARGLDARAGRVPARAPARVGRRGRASPAPHRPGTADRREAGRPREVGGGARRRRVLVMSRESVERLAAPSLLIAVLVIWQIATAFAHPDFILSPWEIARHVVEALWSGELLPHVGASLARSLPGFVFGSLIGVVLGLLAGVARSLDQLLSPVVFLTYPVPKIVFLPIVMLWVGIGDVSKIAVIALACFTRASSTPTTARAGRRPSWCGAASAWARTGRRSCGRAWFRARFRSFSPGSAYRSRSRSSFSSRPR